MYSIYLMGFTEKVSSYPMGFTEKVSVYQMSEHLLLKYVGQSTWGY